MQHSQDRAEGAAARLDQDDGVQDQHEIAIKVEQDEVSLLSANTLPSTSALPQPSPKPSCATGSVDFRRDDGLVFTCANVPPPLLKRLEHRGWCTEPLAFRSRWQATRDPFRDGSRVLDKPYHVTAVVMQALGQPAAAPCSFCAREAGPFTQCRVLAGVGRGACANCYWVCRGAQCNHRCEKEAQKAAAVSSYFSPFKRPRASLAGASSGDPHGSGLSATQSALASRMRNHRHFQLSKAQLRETAIAELEAMKDELARCTRFVDHRMEALKVIDITFSDD